MRLMVTRPPRQHPPLPEPQPLDLAAAPREAGRPMGNLFQALLPAAGGIGMMLFMVSGRNTMFMFAGAFMLLATVGGALAMYVLSRTGPRKKHHEDRGRYLQYLEEIRDYLREQGTAYRLRARQVHPDPSTLGALASSPRAFERRRHDADFGHVRVGIGSVPYPVTVGIPKPSSPLEHLDPVVHRALTNISATYRSLRDQPVTVDLAATDSTIVSADSREALLTMARVMMSSLAALHAPHDLGLAIASPQATHDFQFSMFLPHCEEEGATDGVVPRRWIAATTAQLAAELADEFTRRERALRSANSPVREPRHLFIFLDEWTTGTTGPVMSPALAAVASLSDLQVSVIRLARDPRFAPDDVQVRLDITGDNVLVTNQNGGSTLARMDSFSRLQAMSVARALAPVGATPELDEVDHSNVTVNDLLGVDDVTNFDPEVMWGPKSRSDSLTVAVGVDTHGRPVTLDLKEASLNGMGPHGLVIGATGSGKSELLRMMVLGLAINHSPEDLSFVLVDFKGGATFAGLETLPHVAGVITNLQDDTGLVDRMAEAMDGEIARRQQLLLDHGNFAHLFEYKAARRNDTSIPAIPHLVLIVDEFAELMSAKPDIAELFETIGRVGRSIGVHQTLASQRIDGGKIRQFESYLSYRFALRTFNAEESRAVIGTAEAFELPSAPGSGFLKVDSSIFKQFQAGYVSGPYERPTSTAIVAPPVVQELSVLNRFGRDEHLSPVVTDSAVVDTSDQPAGRSLLDVAVSAMESDSYAVHQVWSPPLAHLHTTADVFRRFGPPVAGGPTVARVGTIDIPREQRQEPLDLEIGGNDTHIAILGGPQSGKSTTLRAIAHSLAQVYSPTAVTCHAIDLSGALRQLRDLPNVGTIAGRADPALTARLLFELETEIDRREALFEAHGIHSLGQLRSAFADGRLPQLTAAEIVLFVDGYATIRTDHDDWHDKLVALVTRGGRYGLHVILTASRLYELRSNIHVAIPTTIELRLNEPSDTCYDRVLAKSLTDNTPGRGQVPGPYLAHIAVPGHCPGDDIDQSDETHLVTAENRSASELQQRWSQRAIGVRMLPERLSFTELESLATSSHLAAPRPPTDIRALQPLLLGVTEPTIDPVWAELSGADPHLFVFGDHESGKTNVLKLLAHQLMALHDPEELVIAVVDPRRSLLGDIPEAYCGAYAHNAQLATSLASSLAGAIDERQPAGLSPQELLNHQWRGPHIVCLVDDADTLPPNCLDPLAERAAIAADVGFHLVMARHSGGLARVTYQPGVSRFRELGATALLLSGDPDEGHVWGKSALNRRSSGRAMMVRRGVEMMTQTAFLDRAVTTTQ